MNINFIFLPDFISPYLLNIIFPGYGKFNKNNTAVSAYIRIAFAGIPDNFNPE